MSAVPLFHARKREFYLTFCIAQEIGSTQMVNATRTEERKNKSIRIADGASDVSSVDQKQPQFYAYIVSPSWRPMRMEFIAELSQELAERIRRRLDDGEAEVILEIDSVKESMSLSQRLWRHPDAYIVVLSENGKQVCQKV